MKNSTFSNFCFFYLYMLYLVCSILKDHAGENLISPAENRYFIRLPKKAKSCNSVSNISARKANKTITQHLDEKQISQTFHQTIFFNLRKLYYTVGNDCLSKLGERVNFIKQNFSYKYWTTIGENKLKSKSGGIMERFCVMLR